MAPTLPRKSYEANRSAGLHSDSSSRAWDSGQSTSALPRTVATAERSQSNLAQGMRVSRADRCGTLYQASLAFEATLKYANDNRASCNISDRLLGQLEKYQREVMQTDESRPSGGLFRRKLCTRAISAAGKFNEGWPGRRQGNLWYPILLPRGLRRSSSSGVPFRRYP